jgi:hypothetical protein
MIVLVYSQARAWVAHPQQTRAGLSRRRSRYHVFTKQGSQNSKDYPPRFRKKHQIRERSRIRKPPGYWLEVKNVEAELRNLWKSVNVNIDPKQPPPIPNESLLNYWKRYDLRSAIVQNDGREILSELLGGALIVPGKWSEAKETIWVKQVIQEDPDLSAEYPPLSPQQLRLNSSSDTLNKVEGSCRRWAHTSSRKEKGYWSSEIVVIKEL